jgi:hypothetical protein
MALSMTSMPIWGQTRIFERSMAEDREESMLLAGSLLEMTQDNNREYYEIKSALENDTDGPVSIAFNPGNYKPREGEYIFYIFLDKSKIDLAKPVDKALYYRYFAFGVYESLISKAASKYYETIVCVNFATNHLYTFPVDALKRLFATGPGFLSLPLEEQATALFYRVHVFKQGADKQLEASADKDTIEIRADGLALQWITQWNTGVVLSLALGPDDKYLAVGSIGEIVVLGWPGYKKLFSFEQAEAFFSAAAFSQDKKLFAAGFDNQIMI